MKKIAVLYHADCSDGFGGAWAAWMKFKEKADYLPAQHNEPPPKGLKNRELYFIDFTYFGKDLEKLKKENRLTIIDHHISAKKEALSAHAFLYDVNHSGAVLTWKFFHKGKKTPKLLQYIENRDIWKFTLPNAREILSVIDLYKRDFKIWSVLAKKLENNEIQRKFSVKGKAMLEYEKNAVEKLVLKADLGVFEKRKAWIINTALLRDEVADVLRKRGPALVVIWTRRGNHIYVSLRSKGNIDVSKLAQKYRGGGHKNAAGFRLKSSEKLPWRYNL